MNSLENLYTLEGILKDDNGDGLSDGLKGFVVLKKDAQIEEKRAAINIAARLAFESVSIDIPAICISLPQICSGGNIIINPHHNGYNYASIKSEADGNIYLTSDSSESICFAGEYLSGRFPYIWDVGDGFAALSDIRKSVSDAIHIDVKICEICLEPSYKGLACIKFLSGHENMENIKKYKPELQKLLKCFQVKKIEIYNDDGYEGEKIAIMNENQELKRNCNDNGNDDECIHVEKKGSIDLSEAFKCGGLFSDTDGDFLPDYINAKIVIQDDADEFETAAASEIAVKLGLESLGIGFPIVLRESEIGDTDAILIFIGRCSKKYYIEKNSGETSISIINTGEKEAILIKGKGEELIALTELFAKEKLNLRKLKGNMKRALSFSDYNGQISMVDSVLKNMKADKIKGQEAMIYHSGNDLDDCTKSNIKKYFDDKYGVNVSHIMPYNTNKTIWEKEYSPEWEVHDFIDIFKKEVLPGLKKGDSVKVLGILSEEKEIRDTLKDEIMDMILKCGAEPQNIEIYSAYKQGLSWIMDGVIPKIKEQNCEKTVDHIVIGFKKFLRDGKNEWSNVEGAMPSYSVQEDDEKRWLELPIKWLQEIYPVDDLISKELGIGRDKVEFRELSDNDTSTYRISIMDKNGKEILSDDYNAKYSERPYIDKFKGLGKVHPSTGWISVTVNGANIIDCRIKTDLEKIWDIYQSEVLTKCTEYAEEKCGGRLSSSAQPFFKELKIELSLSEPDFDLGIRDDRVSALDAFHEDIYFVTLDLFKTLGERKNGKGFGEPGLILPFIEKTNGKGPRMKVTLSDAIEHQTGFAIGNRKYKIDQRRDIPVRISNISLRGGKVRVCFEITDRKYYEDAEEMISSYCDLKDNGVFPISEQPPQILEGIDIMVSGEKGIKHSINFCNVNYADKYSENIIDENKFSVFCDKVIGYDDYIKLIEKLKGRKGVSVWQAAESYQGRKIYAVDLLPEFKSQIVSRTKLINERPTYMIINRHHANEVSSTNSAFLLIEKMINDKTASKFLKRVNLTVMPVENVDGTYIHYILQKQNPKWKLHTARFNSVGKEFAYDYWEDSKYGESKAMTTVWKKWLPDISVDNHGVPTHEWDQQFSGYVSPWFRGFWLPRGIFYGIFYCLTDPEYAHQKCISREVRDYAADKLNEDKEIVKWQLDWKDRFIKYASNWMPKMFQADYYKNLVFYQVDCNKQTSKKPSHKYPDISSMDWITEVSDETAQGEYLKLCTKVHHISDMAVIEMLSKVKPEFINESFSKDNRVMLKRIRKRPLKSLKSQRKE